MLVSYSKYFSDSEDEEKRKRKRRDIKVRNALKAGLLLSGGFVLGAKLEGLRHKTNGIDGLKRLADIAEKVANDNEELLSRLKKVRGKYFKFAPAPEKPIKAGDFDSKEEKRTVLHTGKADKEAIGASDKFNDKVQERSSKENPSRGANSASYEFNEKGQKKRTVVDSTETPVNNSPTLNSTSINCISKLPFDKKKALKIGAGVLGVAGLGYGGYKLYKHYKDKKKEKENEDDNN